MIEGMPNMEIEKEAYCPVCKVTHHFSKVEIRPWKTNVTHTGWCCPASGKSFTNSMLESAFLDISKNSRLEKEKSKCLTLPTDSQERKNYPLLSGCLKYFAAALAGVANTSKLGNDKHNPGQPLHHARGKSSDHGDCIVRHLIDTEDLLAAKERGNTSITNEQILTEASALAWRALAYSQELHEKLNGAPLASGAKE